MWSAIIGDIIGSRFEVENNRSVYFSTFEKNCRFTDDTVCTSAIASLLNNFVQSPKPEAGFKKINGRWAAITLKTFCLRNINRGFGSMFYQWVVSGDWKPYNSFGNGALMRISPVPFFGVKKGFDIEYVKDLAMDFTNVTHNNPRAQKAVSIYVEILFHLLSNKLSVEDAKKYITDTLLKNDYPYPQKIEQYRLIFDFDVTCENCLLVACAAILESSSYLEVFHNAVSTGGDSDTICAVAGPMAEAIWGLDEKSLEAAKLFFREQDSYLLEEIEKLYT